jgi:bacteriocin-like protein
MPKLAAASKAKKVKVRDLGKGAKKELTKKELKAVKGGISQSCTGADPMSLKCQSLRVLKASVYKEAWPVPPAFILYDK